MMIIMKEKNNFIDF